MVDRFFLIPVSLSMISSSESRNKIPKTYKRESSVFFDDSWSAQSMLTSRTIVTHR